MNLDLAKITIKDTHEALVNNKITVADLVGAYLKNIKEKNNDINAYLETYTDVMDQIERAQDMINNGTSTMLTGIPVAIKDNMLFADHISSAGSKILENYNATYDSFVVAELKRAGAVILGRTNMDEFAMGSSNETSAYRKVLNPLDYTRVPGGSSGGSCAAVAMHGAFVALGTDTGGSIRQPASFCGLVGLKPTYGAISRSGIIALSSSLDQVGPIGKSVADVEILFDLLNGYDKNDSTSTPLEMRKSTIINMRKKIGVPRDFLNGDGVDKEVLKNFDESCKVLEEKGYEIVDVSLPLMKYSLAVYYILQPAEASSNLARYDGIKYGVSERDTKNLFDIYVKTRGKNFGKEVRRRIMLGTYILSKGYSDQYYKKAYALKKEIKKEIEKIFEEVDAIITPSCPFLPFKFGEKSDNPVSMYLSDLFLVPANIAELPAISVPSGKTDEGLPIGLHIMAPMWHEGMLFEIGKDFENK